MAEKKILAGNEPTSTVPEGIKISNSATKRGRSATRVTKARQKEEIKVPQAGVEHQTWIWREKGSGTLMLPSTYKVNVPHENGGSRQDTIIFSEGSPEVLLSKMVNWNEKPVKSPIRMYNSILHVPAENETLQKYLIHLVYYGGYNDIYLDDPQAEALKEIDKFNLIDANAEAIKELDTVSLRSIANSLRIGVDSITPKAAIIARIRNYNQDNPEALSKVVSDDASEVYFISSEVFVNGLVELNNNSLLWEDGTGIIQVPANQDAKTYLAQEILNNATLRKNWLSKFKQALIDYYPE